MAINKYCNLYGENKIKDDYTKINDGFAAVEADVTGVLNSEDDREAAETQREVNEALRVLRYENTKHYNAYNHAMTYHRNNIVSHGGCSYMLIVDESTGNAPPVYPVESNTWWAMVGKKGDKGDTGTVPNIQIGTVTTLQPTDPATVSRQVGSPDTEPVFDFGIPKGIDGTGAGDMTKLVYDSDDDGSVDMADTLKGLTIPVSELNKFTPSADQMVSLLWGMNLIRIPEIATAPKFEFLGFSYTNLLGKDGNCEDLSKWSVYNSTPTLDTANKVFGNSSIKITILSSDGGNIFKGLSSLNVDVTKYYLFTAYLKNGTASSISIIKDSNGGGVALSAGTTDTTKFVRVGILLQPSVLNASNAIYPFVGGTTGQYAYVDGIMFNEISAADYASGLTACMDKYSYIDSYACLTNPMFENRRYNLIPNGNCEEGVGYWMNSNPAALAVSIENNKFKIIGTGGGSLEQVITLKPNTNYYYSGNISGLSDSKIRIILNDGIYTTIIRDGAGTFNSGNYTSVRVRMSVYSSGTTYFDSIMLVEGTTAPTEYKSCDLRCFVVEGQFTQDDKVTVENQQITGQLNWKHKTLFGKDYDWRYNGTAGSTSKEIALTNKDFSYAVANGSHFIKYDGKELTSMGDIAPVILGDQYRSWYALSYLLLGVSNTDAGWIDEIAPNDAEIAALMNGWEVLSNDGSRYVVWGNKLKHNLLSIDITAYPADSATTLTVATTAGATSITVANASIFKIGDRIFIYGMGHMVITNIVGNVITTDTGTGIFPIGRVVMRGDNPSTGDTRLLQYCKANVAPGYEGYQLHYKLANPEPITDSNVTVSGAIWDLVKGDNYITVDSGIVLGEVANPTYDSRVGSEAYNINCIGSPYVPDSPLRYKTEIIDAIYANDILDQKWIHTYSASLSNGNDRVYTLLANFDKNAIYTVDYQILKTLHCKTFGSLSLSYPQSIISTLEGHSKALEQKQPKDSALDNLIDLSIYEVKDYQNVYCSWVRTNGVLYVKIEFVLVPKVTIPIITVSNLRIRKGSAGVMTEVTNKFALASANIRKDYVALAYQTSDATTITDIVSYGIDIMCILIADCGGRI